MAVKKVSVSKFHGSSLKQKKEVSMRRVQILEAESAWYPMATAPKDRKILVCDPEKPVPVIAYYIHADEQFPNGMWVLDTDSLVEFQFMDTWVWRDIPRPPTLKHETDPKDVPDTKSIRVEEEIIGQAHETPVESLSKHALKEIQEWEDAVFIATISAALSKHVTSATSVQSITEAEDAHILKEVETAANSSPPQAPSKALVACPPFTQEERVQLREILLNEDAVYPAEMMRVGWELCRKLGSSDPLTVLTALEWYFLLSAIDASQFPDREDITPELMQKLRVLSSASFLPTSEPPLTVKE